MFARRPAPIRVNYLGYAGTMGADFYDCIIADETVRLTRNIEHAYTAMWQRAQRGAPPEGFAVDPR